MTSTRDTGSPQQLKITMREALRGAKRRRQEEKPHQAEAKLVRAAEARERLLSEYLSPTLKRKLAAPATDSARRRALAAHLLNAGKDTPNH